MKKILLQRLGSVSFFLFLGMIISSCQQEKEPISVDLPIDKEATTETVALYNNLKELAKEHVLYGHQDDLAYGFSWWAESGRSDVKESTGSYPAVYGWDLGDLIQDGATENLDHINFEDMKGWIKEGYERGGVITLSWHMNHPVTGGNSWDRTPGVAAILPDGEQHEKYNAWLDKFAGFLNDLKGANGEAIPVLFRPFHEHTGSWFWWGEEQTTVDEYVSLWRYTVEYLRDEKDIHNLLYVYSPDNQAGREFSNYMKKYPGDEYVDVLGMDDYGSLNEREVAGFSDELAWLVEQAEEKNKIAVLSETGLDGLSQKNWWTTKVLGSLETNPKARGIAYILTWRNANKERENREHFYASYPDHPSAENMKTFRDTEMIMFEDELPNLYTIENQ